MLAKSFKYTCMAVDWLILAIKHCEQFFTAMRYCIIQYLRVIDRKGSTIIGIDLLLK